MKESQNEGVCYVSAGDAVDYLAQHVGGTYQARTLIIDAMHSGDLVTRCDTLWEIRAFSDQSASYPALAK